MAVRRMEPADVAEVCALSEQLGYPIAAELLRENLAALSSLPDHLACVAVADGRVLGWIHAARNLVLFEPAWVEVEGLVVSEERRGLGIGAALLRAAEEWGRQRGLGQVRLGCRVTRSSAHRFYERMGYRVSKTQHRFVRAV